MRKVVILDTWVNDTNLGNKVIMEAVTNLVREMFPHDFVYHVPALEYVDAGRHLVQGADHVFLAGTNLLSADMNRTSEWRLRLTDARWLRKVVLFGVGWWQYQAKPVNLYTRLLLRWILHRRVRHAVRDSYTASRLRALGFGALNAGCPSIWKLTPDHCAEVPKVKGDAAVLTFTEYNQDPAADRLLFETVARNYARTYLWPQQYGDYAYGRSICGDAATVVDPSLEAFYDLLSGEEVDYVGTRLHAGIAALRHRRRALIVAVDNRAAEMGRDFNLPVIDRRDVPGELEQRIRGEWATDVRLDRVAIEAWRRQFA